MHESKVSVSATSAYGSRPVPKGETVQVLTGRYAGRIGTCVDPVEELQGQLVGIEMAAGASPLYVPREEARVLIPDSDGLYTPGILAALRAECGL